MDDMTASPATERARSATTDGLTPADCAAIEATFAAWRAEGGRFFPWDLSIVPAGLDDDPSALIANLTWAGEGETSIYLAREASSGLTWADLRVSIEPHGADTVEQALEAIAAAISTPAAALGPLAA